MNDTNIVKGLLMLLLFYVVQIVGTILYIVIANAQGINPIDGMLTAAGGNAVMLGLLIPELLILIILARRYKNEIKKSLKYVVDNRRVTIIKVIVYTVILFLFLNIAMIFDNNFFAEYVTETGENEELLQAIMSSGITIPTFLVIAVTGPIFEEYIFRYGLMKKLLGKLNVYVAAIISTIVFAFIHVGFAQILSNEIGYTLHLFLLYIPISLILNLIYAREDDLFLPICIHIINNTISILVSVYALSVLI